MTRSRSLARSGLVWAVGIALLAGSAAAPDASAVALRRVDKFEGGTTRGWVIDLPKGAGGSNRLAGRNPTLWSEKHLTQNVLDLPTNVIDLGASDPSRRFFVADSVAKPPTKAADSKPAISLPSGSGWSNAVFATTADALSAVAGSATPVLSGLDGLRIFHSLTSAFPGEINVTQFWVPNAATVPEPGTGVLLGLGLAALATRRRPG